MHKKSAGSFAAALFFIGYFEKSIRDSHTFDAVEFVHRIAALIDLPTTIGDGTLCARLVDGVIARTPMMRAARLELTRDELPREFNPIEPATLEMRIPIGVMLRPIAGFLPAWLQESDPAPTGPIVSEGAAAIKAGHAVDAHPSQFCSIDEHADDPPRVVNAIVTQPGLVDRNESRRPSISINVRDRRGTHREDGQAKDD